MAWVCALFIYQLLPFTSGGFFLGRGWGKVIDHEGPIYSEKKKEQNKPDQKRHHTHIHHPQPLYPSHATVPIHTRVRFARLAHFDRAGHVPHAVGRGSDVFLRAQYATLAHIPFIVEQTADYRQS